MQSGKPKHEPHVHQHQAKHASHSHEPHSQHQSVTKHAPPESPNAPNATRPTVEIEEQKDDVEISAKSPQKSSSKTKTAYLSQSSVASGSTKRYCSTASTHSPSVPKDSRRSVSPLPSHSPRASLSPVPSPKTTSARRPSSKKRVPVVPKAPPPPPTEPPTAANRQERWAKLFESLDTSGDYLIDKQEFLSAATRWTEACPRLLDDEIDFLDWDTDGNGYLTEGEFFCFCDALWQILGERGFQALEAELRNEKATARSQGVEPTGNDNQEKKTISFRDEVKPPLQEVVEVEKLDPSEEERRHQAAVTIQRIERGRSARMKQNTDRKKSLSGAELAEEKLRESMATVRDDPKDGRKALRKAINEARSAGVDRQLCDEAVLLVRIVEVEEVLQRAMESKNPTLLRVAMLNVSNMGPDHPMLKEAEMLLSSLEVKEKISKALKSSSCGELESAIVKAQSAGYGEDELDKLQHKLQKMKWRKSLDEAWNKKDVLMVKGFIAELEKTEVQDGILYEAIQMVPIIEKYHAAKKELGKAVCTGTVNDVAVAIDEAQKCGVDPCEVERARRILRKEEAKTFLANAISSEKRKSLLDALAKAEEYDVNIPEVDIAQKLLKKLDVSRDITLAIDNRDPAALRAVVEDARAHGVDSVKVEKAEKLIAQLDSAGYGDDSKVAAVRMANLHNMSE